MKFHEHPSTSPCKTMLHILRFAGLMTLISGGKRCGFVRQLIAMTSFHKTRDFAPVRPMIFASWNHCCSIDIVGLLCYFYRYHALYRYNDGWLLFYRSRSTCQPRHATSCPFSHLSASPRRWHDRVLHKRRYHHPDAKESWWVHNSHWWMINMYSTCRWHGSSRTYQKTSKNTTSHVICKVNEKQKNT